MIRKFAILGMPRCGSTFLCTALDSNPSIVVHGEMFLPDRIGPFRGALRRDVESKPDLKSLAWRDAHPIPFLEQILNHDPTVYAAGFKIFYPQNKAVLDYVCGAQDYAKIFIRRDNILAVYSSEQIARQTGQWHVRAARKEELRQAKIEFDAAVFEEFVERHKKAIAIGESFCERAKGPVLEITYSDIARHVAFSRVFDFLQIPGDRNFETKQVKQNPGRILDRFLNSGFVAAYLQKIGRSDWAREL